jgi:diguanylate cyclase (GGDEF)-like protein
MHARVATTELGAEPARRAADRLNPERPANTQNEPGSVRTGPSAHSDMEPADHGGSMAAERHRGEVLVGWVQLGVLGLFALLYVLAPGTVDSDGRLAPVPLFLAVHGAFTFYRIRRARHRSQSAAFTMTAAAVDMALLLGLIWSFHLQYGQPAAFYLKAPTFLYVFIFISVRALGFDVRSVAAAGVAAIVGWLTLVAYAFIDGGQRTRSFVEYMTSNQVLVGAELDKVVVIAVVTGLLCSVVARTRTLVRHQIDARREVGALNTTLRRANDSLTDEMQQRLHYQAEVERVAYHDTVTRLSNRAGFERCMRERTQARPQSRFCVLMFDLDGFRLVNGASGFAVGDEVLRAIADRLYSTLRTDDITARLGNDEFAAFIEFPLTEEFASMTDAEALQIVSQRLAERLSAPLPLFGSVGRLSACFGMIPARSGTSDPLAMLRDAEIALERAKAVSPGTALVYEPGWARESRERRNTESALAEAVREKALTLHYQPIVGAEDGQVAYFEALMRWEHPERGAVSPAEFIPIAEATGMIHELGALAIDEALRQLCRWQRDLDLLPGRAPIGMSINLSTRQFERPDDLLDVLDQALARYPVDPKTIYLEVTESVMVNDVAAMCETLDAITAMGPKLLLDDFGTGYSCFGLLPTLPLHGLKIDRSFVPPVAEAGRGVELVSSILSMANRLDLTVVAEGVETEAQRARLAALGCPLLQGYLLAKPMAADAATDYLLRNLTPGSVGALGGH